ncbi:GNAT family N-acetyltransferase [Yinghuangia soli]|uniref:Lysine N-acyltransferase MbtK n=1 Tax=Yinghuangia soli TaxID=2908204 RepID=A0AA41PXL6_9ACTN|nr:GNAT family N-acetyltransferase [Yinghuangia soli]MCF2527719.1 acetyltransferase [Yinghuangia soli]
MISWRRVTEDDFPLLARWLAEPHVARWWNHETTAEAVARDFGPSARGAEPSQDWLASVDGVPCALVQRSFFADYPEYLDELGAFLDVPDGTLSLDYLIGERDLVGQGLGPRIIASAVAKAWADEPSATGIMIPVSTANQRSWRALEKAGLARIAEVELTPDNPVDDRAHVVYYLARPAGA